ncbi:SDR family oxidoreductase [Cryobacterium sp. PH31-O1]|uniref:SDR family oxidoreductase n=1 Tax=Cryobacterium sp. PH31-O1 TaxID=3046306 RepID=UPI0024BA6BAA|nr:SDR family oxidoreductase [Cryobacterium sp. PH31-O1]MDJ0337901.1 SDR family oxidoreductase [Cryobacterium sp. PH31-O1]
MTKSVLVTGATGTVGDAVTEFLLERGESVLGAVRNTDDAVHLREGVEARHFDFSMSPAELDQALDGCDRLFLMRPPAIADVEKYLFPVINAAGRRGIQHIVFLSLQGVQQNRSTPHYAVEQYLKSTGAPYTSLRPNFFMQNLSTTHAAEIREDDDVFVPAGRSFTAFIDARDIGRVAAAVLTEPGHIGRSYTLSGEQSLTYRNVAAILSHTLGRSIHYRRPSETEYLVRLRKQGKPEDYIAVQKMIYRIVRFNISAFPNRSVRRLTGQPATTFLEFAARERDAWER